MILHITLTVGINNKRYQFQLAADFQTKVARFFYCHVLWLTYLTVLPTLKLQQKRDLSCLWMLQCSIYVGHWDLYVLNVKLMHKTSILYGDQNPFINKFSDTHPQLLDS